MKGKKERKNRAKTAGPPCHFAGAKGARHVGQKSALKNLRPSSRHALCITACTPLPPSFHRMQARTAAKSITNNHEACEESYVFASTSRRPPCNGHFSKISQKGESSLWRNHLACLRCAPRFPSLLPLATPCRHSYQALIRSLLAWELALPAYPPLLKFCLPANLPF